MPFISFIVQVMCLKFKCFIVYLVSQNVIISHQIFLNNQFIGNDLLHGNGRRYYNFDYDFSDRNKETQSQLFDYRHHLNGNNDGPSPKHDGKPRAPADNATETIQTKTIPMIFVTIPSLNTLESSSAATIPVVETATVPTVETLTVSTVESYPNGFELNKPTVSGVETLNVSSIIDTSKVPDIETLKIPIVKPPTTSIVETLTIPVETSTVSFVTTLAVPNESVSILNLNETSTSITITGKTQNITIASSAVTQEWISKPIAITTNPITATGQEMAMSETTASELGMTFPYSDISQPVPVRQPSQIAQQVLQDMHDMAAGYFTVFLLETARIFAKKKREDASRLLQALEMEVAALLSAGKLSGFGKSTIAAFVQFVETLNNTPVEAVQYEATIANYILLNRRKTLGREIVNLIDQTDSVILEEEGKRIIHVLEDMDSYPNINKTAAMIVHEMMDAVVVAPFIRVYGTAEEVAFVQQLEDLVINMVFSGYAIQRRTGLHDRRTTRSNNYIRYRTNPIQIMGKIKMHKNKRKQNTLKRLQAKYITTFTKKQLSANQKRIYINKKNKTNRCKIRPKEDINNGGGKYKAIYYKLTDSGRADVNRKIFNTQLISETIKESANPKYQLTRKLIKLSDKKVGIKRNKLIIRKNEESKDLKTHNFVANKIREESSFTDEEDMLKANLDDAFFHGNKELEFRNKERLDREFETKYVFPVSSYSNEEAVLKSKIYKVFGFGNDLAGDVKTKQVQKF